MVVGGGPYVCYLNLQPLCPYIVCCCWLLLLVVGGTGWLLVVVGCGWLLAFDVGGCW